MQLLGYAAAIPEIEQPYHMSTPEMQYTHSRESDRTTRSWYASPQPTVCASGTPMEGTFLMIVHDG